MTSNEQVEERARRAEVALKAAGWNISLGAIAAVIEALHVTRRPDETPARREYHANGTYWSGAPTVDMPCDFCARPFVNHDPRTHACPSDATSDHRP